MTTQSDIIEFLSQPKAYGDLGSVARIETHISVVFLVGERAYKLKRALHFDYVDYELLSRREYFCRREASRNHRTAPQLYLGVVPVTIDRDGALTLNGVGDSVEWLVVMRRFDQEFLFDRLALDGALDDRAMVRLADRVFSFHHAAECVADVSGAASMRAVLKGNASALRAASQLDHKKVTAWITQSKAALDRVESLLERRGEQGAIRDCHGDLHLRNICMFEDEPTLFDGVEFNDALTSIDVLYDFAFLLMDLAHRGEPGLANVVCNRYLAMAGHDAYVGMAAMGLFQSCRAAIRTHTTLAAAQSQSMAAKSIVLQDEARAYLDLALRFLEPTRPELIVIGGLSGTGKSTVAAGLAPMRGLSPGAIVLRSDVIRKRMFGIAPEGRLAAQAYDRAVTVQVYDWISEVAGRLLDCGKSVVVDAVYAAPAERDAIEAVARNASAPFCGLWLSAPSEVLQDRVAARRGDASDADADIVKQQLQYDLGPVRWLLLDASGSPEATLQAAQEAIGHPSSERR